VTADGALLHSAAQLLDARIGLKPDISFRPRLARALRDVADAMHIEREELVGALATDTALFDALLERITVQESGFFRHPEQFEIFARVLLPRASAPFKTWSAACANGQEAYSLAMIMSEVGGPGSVFASDVSPAALRRTTMGSYRDREMGGVSAERRNRHFVRAGDGWQARQNLREMITVQRHNLLDPIPLQVAACHVVMCRNVLIYFKLRHAELFLDRLADTMSRSAYLFVGAAETLWQLTDRFEPAQIGVSYVYQPIPRGRRRRPAIAAVRASAAPPSLLSASLLRPSVAITRLEPRPVLRTPAPIVAVKATAPPQPIDETGEDYGRLGRELLAAGSVQPAIVAFRQWTFLSPDDPTAHFQLGSALDAADARASALRAYRAALAALDRGEPEQLVDVLHGFSPFELRRLLIDRCLAAGVHPGASPPAKRPQRDASTVTL
jgi:chemotaxis protein methyltransferase CheR